MQPARLTYDDAPLVVPVPKDLQHKRLEVIFWPIETTESPAPSGRRKPPVELKGKVVERGDVIQSIPADDWGV